MEQDATTADLINTWSGVIGYLVKELMWSWMDLARFKLRRDMHEDDLIKCSQWRHRPRGSGGSRKDDEESTVGT